MIRSWHSFAIDCDTCNRKPWHYHAADLNGCEEKAKQQGWLIGSTTTNGITVAWHVCPLCAKENQ